MKIAWIGCGVMGTSMLLNLKKGGHTVSAYNRTYEKAAPLLEQGIRVLSVPWSVTQRMWKKSMRGMTVSLHMPKRMPY